MQEAYEASLKKKKVAKNKKGKADLKVAGSKAKTKKDVASAAKKQPPKKVNVAKR